MKKARLEIEYNEYGIPILEKSGNPNLSFRSGNPNELYIEGNRDALILLAKALLGLAECEVDYGFHIHLDELYGLNDTDKTVIINKIK